MTIGKTHPTLKRLPSSKDLNLSWSYRIVCCDKTSSRLLIAILEVSESRFEILIQHGNFEKFEDIFLQLSISFIASVYSERCNRSFNVCSSSINVRISVNVSSSFVARERDFVFMGFLLLLFIKVYDS